jgi:hypothetical protein
MRVIKTLWQDAEKVLLPKKAVIRETYHEDYRISSGP